MRRCLQFQHNHPRAPAAGPRSPLLHLHWGRVSCLLSTSDGTAGTPKHIGSGETRTLVMAGFGWRIPWQFCEPSRDCSVVQQTYTPVLVPLSGGWAWSGGSPIPSPFLPARPGSPPIFSHKDISPKKTFACHFGICFSEVPDWHNICLLGCGEDQIKSIKAWAQCLAHTPRSHTPEELVPLLYQCVQVDLTKKESLAFGIRNVSFCPFPASFPPVFSTPPTTHSLTRVLL